MNLTSAIPKETLLFIIITITGYGASVLGIDLGKGLICLGIGAILIIVRAYLKKQGYPVSHAE